MSDGRAAFLAVAAGLGLVAGWLLTHAVLALTGYEGDPSTGAAFTGAAIVGVASAAGVLWLVARRGRDAG